VSSLDCYSVDTAMTSLAELLGILPEALGQMFDQLPISRFDDKHRATLQRPQELLWQLIFGRHQPPTPDIVYWFHATRVQPTTDFAEGLLPLNERVSITRQFLTELAIRNGLKTEASAVMSGNPEKMRHKIHHGPFAYLVRDAILTENEIGHDYLKTPELVEDLVPSLELVACFQRETTPCIVKFRTSDPRPDTVPVALYYCYLAAWGEPPGIFGNTCYNGEGVAVPANDIVLIEYLRNR
jgi:hypothetical protein